MQEALDRAALASNADRIEHRDELAAFGPAIVNPLLGWVSERRYPHFVITVFEKLGHADEATALSALAEAEKLDPSLAAEADDARDRLRLRSAPQSRTRGQQVRGTGVLDQVTPFGPPIASGECMGLTQKGEPCRNPGRYWVGDKLSCSRRHAEYR